MRQSDGVEATLLKLFLIAYCVSLVSASAADQTAKLSKDLRILKTVINGSVIPTEAFVIIDETANLLVSDIDLQLWRVLIPAHVTSQALFGRNFYALNEIAKFDYRIDEAEQTLNLRLPPNAFRSTQFSLSEFAETEVDSVGSGAFLNYDSLYEGGQNTNSRLNAAIELGYFNRWGSGTSSFVLSSRDKSVVRLNTSWRYDWPGKMRSLVIGDSFSSSGAWGRGVQFAGIKWGSNFSTQPDFISFALPQISGETALPSTIELYANSLQKVQKQIPAGPFSVNDIPVVSGINDVALIVTDVLGREVLVEQAYYVNRNQLKQGLQDYSYEFGAIRNSLSGARGHYSGHFFSGTHRLGLTDKRTGEVRLELQNRAKTVGLSIASSEIERIGTVAASIAVSDTAIGSGNLIHLGVHKNERQVSYSVDAYWTSSRFRQLGLDFDSAAPQQTVSARIGLPISNRTSISMSYSQVKRRSDDDIEQLGINVQSNRFENFDLNAFYSNDIASGVSTFGIAFNMRIGARSSARLNSRRDKDGQRTRVQYQTLPPRGFGNSYRLDAEMGSSRNRKIHGELRSVTPRGTFRSEIASNGISTQLRLNASGGVALMGNNLALSRRINDSFGFIKVGKQEQVRVFHENLEVGRTNGNGVAFIPNLRSFDDNSIQVDHADLPIEAQITDLAKRVVPGYRTGIFVEFKIEEYNGALLKLVQSNGEVIPLGALVELDHSDKSFRVARRGEVWLTNLLPENDLKVTWPSGSCSSKFFLRKDVSLMSQRTEILCQGND